MTAQFYKQDAFPVPNLTHPWANVTHLCTTPQRQREKERVAKKPFPGKRTLRNGTPRNGASNVTKLLVDPNFGGTADPPSDQLSHGDTDGLRQHVLASS